MKKNIPELSGRKGKPSAPKIAMLTAYDYPSALLADKAEMDIILVGDSLGMVVLGYESTVPVTLEEMLHHAKAVRRGARDAVLIGDMPFGSFQTSPEEAVHNAVRFLKEAGMDGVKLEGGTNQAEIARAIVRAGVPVMGHIGLLPQLVSQMGGFKVQGRDAIAAQKLIDDALALQEAGCFAIVLEAIPDRLASHITKQLAIPTIGIGAGPECDGQVLVFHDLLGLFDRFTPKFAKKYADAHGLILGALMEYKDEVLKGQFPTQEHSFTIKDEVLYQLYGTAKQA
jgi:3-methyl-2-oxobutanoate hydroxymethyltransferase